MIQTKKQARERLIRMMCEFFGITATPLQRIDISLNEIADFCDLLRRGCSQDVERLALKLVKDVDHRSPGELQAISDFAACIVEGGAVHLWGLDDCQCDRVDCVYCGPRIAKRAMSTVTAEIWFDGHRYMLPRAEHTGENLRAFFGVKRGKDLFVECDKGDDILIEPGSTPYFIDQRDKFYSVSKKITG